MNGTTRFQVVGLFAAAILSACGGSAPSSGSTGPTGPTGSTGPTGTTGVVASRGVVTAVGTLVVNGISFDASTAQIRIDDNPGRPESELKVGMVVTGISINDPGCSTHR